MGQWHISATDGRALSISNVTTRSGSQVILAISAGRRQLKFSSDACEEIRRALGLAVAVANENQV